MRMRTISPRASGIARSCLGVVGAVLLILAMGCGGSPQDASQTDGGRENVVLIVVDTLRGDRLEATRNGVDVMPKLRAYAEKGWNVTRAISPASWTRPAMTSMFTSLYPEVHAVQFLVTNTDYSAPYTTEILAEEIETMGTFFKAQGYNTAALQVNPVLSEMGIERGFDKYAFHTDLQADQVTDAASAILADLEPPFFLYVHYMDPHAPYDPPQTHRELFGPLPEISEQDEEILKEWNSYYKDRVYFDVGTNPKRNFEDLSSSARERTSTLYDGEARFIDDQVDRLLEFIESEHANTFTIVTADHGEELWEHGTIGHGKSVYEELVRVPLILVGQGLTPSLKEEFVQTLDILPTIAARLGLAARPHWQGTSLLDSAANRPDGFRPVFSHNRCSHKKIGMNQWAVYSDELKLVKHLHTEKHYLFDLVVDPGETNDIKLGREEAVEQLTALLEAHWASNHSHSLYTGVAREALLDREIEELIGAIGYIE